VGEMIATLEQKILVGKWFHPLFKYFLKKETILILELLQQFKDLILKKEKQSKKSTSVLNFINSYRKPINNCFLEIIILYTV
jgi:hypothetical protein